MISTHFCILNQRGKTFANFKVKKWDSLHLILKKPLHEIKILKKISEWPKCIDVASTKLEPHRIPIYLYELAAEFHSYWNLGKQFPEKRFINDQKNISHGHKNSSNEQN